MRATDEGRRFLVVSYFEAHSLLDILQAVEAAGFADSVSVIIGSYGVSPEASESAAIFENVSYAPLFSIQPRREPNVSSFYLGRLAAAFTPGQFENLDPVHAGRIPLVADGVPLPAVDEFGWGVELGRRFRDALRLNRRFFNVDGWQFDELISQLATAPGAGLSRYREFVSGVLGGLYLGRPELGDQPEAGVVWASGRAIQSLPTMKLTPSLTKFWMQLEQSARLLVGEEYPWFRDPPAEVALHYAAGQRGLLESDGPVRNELGRRYVAGFTPGVENTIDRGLGGRCGAQTAQEALSWKRSFVQERASTQPRGFGEFCFLKKNADPQVIGETIKTLREIALTAA